MCAAVLELLRGSRNVGELRLHPVHLFLQLCYLGLRVLPLSGRKFHRLRVAVLDQIVDRHTRALTDLCRRLLASVALVNCGLRSEGGPEFVVLTLFPQIGLLLGIEGFPALRYQILAVALSFGVNLSKKLLNLELLLLLGQLSLTLADVLSLLLGLCLLGLSRTWLLWLLALGLSLLL